MEEHQLDLDEPKQWGPIKYIVAIFLLLILVAWVLPTNFIKLNPEPKYIPEINEVVPEFELEVKEIDRTDYLSFIEPDNPVVKYTADKIISLSGCDSNKICQAKAVFYFVRDKFNYVSDPLEFEYIKTASESLKVQVGDCDDASVLTVNILQSIGIKTRFVFVPRHVYVQAYLPDAPRTLQKDGWVSLDLTCRYCKFGDVASVYRNSEKRYL